MKLSRTLLPAALAGALLLTGCSAGGSPTKDEAGADCVAPGAASEAVKVTGSTGVDLKLDAKTPLKATEFERSVLTEGEGGVVTEGDAISVSMTTFNGTTGDEMDQLPESPVPFEKDKLVSWAYEGIRCAVPGQQIALIAPYAEMFQTTDPEQTGYEGMTKDTPIVIVMEFGEISEVPKEPGTLAPDELLKKAEGKAQEAPAGFPTVKLDKDGAPTITMPEGEKAPAELEVATLIEGDGETVEPGDRVYVNYRGVIWRTGEEFDSSWKRGEAAAFKTNEVIPGFTKALEGQKVGSQVISVVPPKDGYGDNLESQLKMSNPDFDVKNDDTLVFVLDIVGTVHAE